MGRWLTLLITVICTLLASSGFWMTVNTRLSRVDATTRLMMGVAYDRITTLGIEYISRGWITKDELEELEKQFYEPYKALGGNGVAQRVMEQVRLLPFRTHDQYADIFRNKNLERYVRNVPVITESERETASLE